MALRKRFDGDMGVAFRVRKNESEYKLTRSFLSYSFLSRVYINKVYCGSQKYQDVTFVAIQQR
jgi:hypothetical protein